MPGKVQMRAPKLVNRVGTHLSYEDRFKKLNYLYTEL